MDIDWTALPPLTTLRAFEATARMGGYSAAARSLNVTPAAIAQQVRKLEVEIGAPLVRKEGRGLVLTDAGRHLASPLREAFELMARGMDEAKLRQSTRGIRVSTTDYFVDVAIIPNLGDFWKKHPAMQVSFSPEGNPKPVDLEKFDVVIRGAGKGHIWEGCQQAQLLESDIIVCGTADLVRSANVDPSSVPWIQDRSIGGNVIEKILTRAGCDPSAVEMIDPGSAKFEMEAVLNGYGLGAGPKLTFRKHLQSGSLVRSNLALGMSGVYYALYRPGPLETPVQLFLDWLTELCAPL